MLQSADVRQHTQLAKARIHAIWINSAAKVVPSRTLSGTSVLQMPPNIDEAAKNYLNPRSAGVDIWKVQNSCDWIRYAEIILRLRKCFHFVMNFDDEQVFLKNLLCGAKPFDITFPNFYNLKTDFAKSLIQEH